MQGTNLLSGGTPPCKTTKGKILLFSYAFPPMQVQMTPAVFKPMAALVEMGYEVDVLCADALQTRLPIDTSLLSAAEKTFPNITRLSSSRMPQSLYSRLMSPIPDLMAPLRQAAYDHLMSIDLSAYEAVVTWSPFHSINPTMVRVKQQRPRMRWLAQFSDPWAGNPLENRFSKIKNSWHEPHTVRAADFIVFSSARSRTLMMKHHPIDLHHKTEVISHVFNPSLYPQRSKVCSGKIMLRYVGVLYGGRSPEPLFLALKTLFVRRPDLESLLQIELVGHVPIAMLQTKAALALPPQTVAAIPNVTYLKSLELMYDADILLLIDEDTKENLFLPSKIADYIGTQNPIVGIVPAGESEDALVNLGSWHARPKDIAGIADAIEGAADHVMNKNNAPWWNTVFQQTFNSMHAAQKFSAILEKISVPKK
jgi:hypothetical protein